MNAFLQYVVQSAVCLSLFYGLYLLLLRRETFFRFNRSVLLVIMLASMALPLIRVPVSEPTLIQKVSSVEVSSLEFRVSGWAKPVDNLEPETHSRATFNPIPLVYFAGFAVSLVLALVSLVSVARVIVTARPVIYRQQRILVSPLKISSFTFAGWIVLSEMDYERFAGEIVTHENIHRREGHFWDLCLMSAIAVVHWFNPLVWLLRREMKALHEYEADRGTLTQGIDATRYQLLLIEKAAGASRYSVASSFAQSKIKKRIVMMNKQNLNPWARWKALLFIPLAALLLQAFARPEIKRELEQISTLKSMEVLQERPNWTEERFQEEFQKGVSLGLIDNHSWKGFEKMYQTGVMITINQKGMMVNNKSVTDVGQLQKKETPPPPPPPPPSQSAVRYTHVYNSGSPVFNVKEAGNHGTEGFSDKDCERITGEFEKIAGQQVMYNGQMTKINDISELLRVDTNDKLMIIYQYHYNPETKEGICKVGVPLPAIDPKEPDFYYIKNGKWIYGGKGIYVDQIKSINTYAPEVAVKRYGNKAKNGAIAITTKE